MRRLTALSLLLPCLASAQVPRPETELIEPMLRPGPARPIERPAPLVRTLADPTLSLGNMIQACQRSARPDVDCMAGLASGTGIIALVGWAPGGTPVSARELRRVRIDRVAPPSRGRREAGIERGRVFRGTTVAEGPFKGVLQSYSLGTSRFEDGILLTGVQRGQCFVATVEAADGRGGTLSATSETACINADTRWGVEKVLAPNIARQQRSRTDDACNRQAHKTLIGAFDLWVGHQRYSGGDCAGTWHYWSLLGFDLSGLPTPFVKAELVSSANADCIGLLQMTTINWRHDPGPVSVNRPYEVLQTRPVTPAPAFRQDVTDWLNTRIGNEIGFQFNRGPSDGPTCISTVAGLVLEITRLR